MRQLDNTICETVSKAIEGSFRNDLGNWSVKKITFANVKKILLSEARQKYRTEEPIVDSRKF